ncbi:class A beta-lactamase-related serine hydrolase [Erythrobacter sp. SDW2]|uniref:serine hydrolase n=1 Tax=Erythrobacter sp. SDW2 TaxID=2907154 RepID=UPI001F422AC4|nr:serine hydrolase [Erythrobacter sp. SDW2]UIP05588.1 class A beta-lactamase-related serine hydrolase [Erythrobacter sp. SDW2]
MFLRPLLAILVACLLVACGEAEGGTPEAAAYQQRIEEGSGVKLTGGPSAEEKALEAELFANLNEFDGYVGVAVHDIDRRRTVDFNGKELFPQQSVSKLWVTLTALRMVDEGELDLLEPAQIGFRDLTLFHQPVLQFVLAQGMWRTTYADLMTRAITQSDNTANDMLLKRVGGPDAVRAMIDKAGLGAIRFGPGEREMQSEIAGVQWHQSYAVGQSFFKARAQVPDLQRRIAFDAYVQDPVDGASPRAIALALGRVVRGELLEKPTAEHLLALLGQVKSGPNRLKGGVPEGWSIGHKTGTGQVLRYEQAGYNDVGILTAPDGRRYSIAVMIGRTALPIPQRMEMMHAIVRAVVSYHYAALGQPVPAGTFPEPEVPEESGGQGPVEAG